MKRWALLLLLSCSSGPEEGTCWFEGRYDLGVDWSAPGYRPECGLWSVTSYAAGDEDECYDVDQDVAATGVIVDTVISCYPGHPVVECVGSVLNSEGCYWPIYIRRIEP